MEYNKLKPTGCQNPIKTKQKWAKLIETLEQIDIDFYKGHYTVGERYDLIKDINEVLKNKRFT